MNRTLIRHTWNFIAVLILVADAGMRPSHGDETDTDWRLAQVLAAPEAHQAAAADRQYVYAIANTRIAKYDRASGKRIAVSTGLAQHLNSGFLWEGKLYAAHSNYPLKPELSQIKVLDLDSMRLSTFKDFGDYGGSLTWVVRRDNHWWCNFARYGADNANTFLVKPSGAKGDSAG